MSQPDQVIVTDPYISTGSNSVTVSIAKALEDGSGVVSLDLDLNDISNAISKIKVGSKDIWSCWIVAKVHLSPKQPGGI